MQMIVNVFIKIRNTIEDKLNIKSLIRSPNVRRFFIKHVFMCEM